MNATAYCNINYSELINCNKYCSILFFTTVNCSVIVLYIPYSCRKLSTVLDKVICLYYYNCYITTETLLQQIISSRPTLLQYGSKSSIYYKLL